ncbi:hypothetical protein H9P43_001013 [Blastocladiella emersonii ATCC 22665]|nr:hypothetical protein H9P43_001013 [Blastocladiella emersonii ATCC 22665]
MTDPALLTAPGVVGASVEFFPVAQLQPFVIRRGPTVPARGGFRAPGIVAWRTNATIDSGGGAGSESKLLAMQKDAREAARRRSESGDAGASAARSEAQIGTAALVLAPMIGGMAV